MKVVNLFIGSFVISCLTLNSNIIAGCCGNKNKKGNNNSSNNNGGQPTPPGTGTGPGKGPETTNPTTTTTTNPVPGKGPETINPTTTTATGAGFGTGKGTTASTTTATVPKTTIQNLGGINGLTATLFGNKIYLSINNISFMVSATTYSGTMEENSIKNVQMNFSITPLNKITQTLTIADVITYITNGKSSLIQPYLNGHTLLSGKFTIRGRQANAVIDINGRKAYEEYSNINNGSQTFNNNTSYFALDLDGGNYGFYFYTPETSTFGYFNYKKSQYYYINSMDNSNFYKSKFDSHTIDDEGFNIS